YREQRHQRQRNHARPELPESANRQIVGLPPAERGDGQEQDSPRQVLRRANTPEPRARRVSHMHPRDRLPNILLIAEEIDCPSDVSLAPRWWQRWKSGVMTACPDRFRRFARRRDALHCRLNSIPVNK